jgi:DNA-binding CsgD family transcriptional regulator
MVSTATAALERAVLTAQDPDALFGALPLALDRLVGCGPVFMAAVDPVTLHFVRAARHQISDEAAAGFLANEMGTPDVVKFRGLANARDPVDSLFHATDRTPRDSARWRDVIEPLGWGDELRIACRHGGRTWGVLCLHRLVDDPPFDETAADSLREVAPSLAAAFRRTALAREARMGNTILQPGVVVLDDQLVVTSMTGPAAEWLDALGPTGDGLPMVVMSVAVQTLVNASPQTVAIATRDGRWLSVHSSPLHGPEADAVAVVLQPAHPTEALPTLAAAAQLTPRETDVTLAMLHGLSDRAIAKSLRISEYTVQDHLKRVYAKTGARGRAELVARLLLG